MLSLQGTWGFESNRVGMGAGSGTGAEPPRARACEAGGALNFNSELDFHCNDVFNVQPATTSDESAVSYCSYTKTTRKYIYLSYRL